MTPHSLMTCCLLFLILSIRSQPNLNPKTPGSPMRVKKTIDFALTGDGNAENWKAAGWFILPLRDTGLIDYKTKVKTLYSDSGLYCLYQCSDEKITATLQADFADLYEEDVVELFLWSDEKLPIYFEYELSPLNFELPILVPNIKGNAFGWRPWHYEGTRKTRHATRVSKKAGVVEGWTAEFFIPFELLKPMLNKAPKKGDRWRANFYRIDYDAGQVTWQWNLVRNTNFHDFERFGLIEFE